MAEHMVDPENCPNHFRVLNLESWQKQQNGTLGRMATAMEKLAEKVDRLESSNDQRTGQEKMLKYIIGITGVGSIGTWITLITLFATHQL